MKSNRVMLRVEEFRAISKAEIKLDGITVVAGVNGCGKSTLSKLLYWAYRGILEFETLFLEPRLKKNINELKEATIHLLSSLIKAIPKDELHLIQKDLEKEQIKFLLAFLSNDINYSARRKIESHFNSIEDVISLYQEIYQEALFLDNLLSEYYGIGGLQPFIFIGNLLELSDNHFSDVIIEYNLSNAISTLISIATHINRDYIIDADLKPKKLLEKKVQHIFHLKQLPNTLKISEDIEVIENEYRSISIFSHDEESLSKSLCIDNIIYIDTPMFFGHTEEEHWKDANEKLKQRPKLNEKPKPIQEIDDLIKRQIFINGAEVKFDELSESFTFRTSSGVEMDLSDSATGMKTFAVLDRLVKNGSINKKTLLILDEPEAHLHPQWIVELGRLLTLINKHIGAKIFVATHSPDMVQALRYIPNKEGTGDNVNFYLAEFNQENGLFDYRDLHGEIDDIFGSFNVSLDKLSNYGED